MNFVEQNSDNASLVLQVNRLSGVVPASVLKMQSINILTGNLFSCDFQRNALPSHDTAYKNYQCGSNAFNQASIVWLSFAFVVLGFGGFVWLLQFYLRNKFVRWCKESWDLGQSYLAVFDDESRNSLKHFKLFILSIRDSALLFTAVILLVFLPVYSVLKMFYGTSKHQYAWTVSAAFLSGTIPAILLMLLYMGFILAMFAIWFRLLGSRRQKEKSFYQQTNSRRTALFGVIVVNVLVMILANGSFVYVILNYSTDIIFVAQIFTAMFKLLWNELALPAMTKFARSRSRPNSSEKSSVEGTIAEEMPYIAFIVLFNSIIAPCLATAAVDNDCFYNVFIAPSSVHSEFLYSSSEIVCNGEFKECATTISVSSIDVSYDPPFIYSYQCTSSMITNYASVYVFMFLIVAFVKPVSMYFLTKTYEQAPVGSCIHVLIDLTIHNLLKPANKNDLIHKKVLFKKDKFVLRMVGKIAVFLTFGVVFPPLAAVLCVAFCSECYVNLMIMGRFLIEIKDEATRNQFLERMCCDCEDSFYVLLNPLVKLVIPFAAVFYAFFVFDIYGDQVGLKKAIWAPVLLLATPYLIRLGYMMKMGWRKQRSDGDQSIEKGIDLISISAVHELGEKSTV